MNAIFNPDLYEELYGPIETVVTDPAALSRQAARERSMKAAWRRLEKAKRARKREMRKQKVIGVIVFLVGFFLPYLLDGYATFSVWLWIVCVGLVGARKPMLSGGD